MGYRSIWNEFWKRTQSSLNDYENKRTAQAKKMEQQTQRVYNDLIATTERDYRQAARETAESYRAAYDANAVSELVARRRAAEAIANVNARHSGLNTTQQTAISLMRGNADVETTRRKQAAVDNLMRELDTLRSKYRAEATEKQIDIRREAASDIADYEARREEFAQKKAAAQYEAELKKREKLYEVYEEEGELGLYSEDGRLSKTAVFVVADMIQREKGDVFAETFLTQSVNNMFITESEKQAIMDELFIPEMKRPTAEEVETEMAEILKSKGKDAAYTYIKKLYDSGLIGVRLREQMYALIDAQK